MGVTVGFSRPTSSSENRSTIVYTSLRAYLGWYASPPRGKERQTASQVRGASFSSSSATHETPRCSRVMVMSLGMLDLPVHRGGRERRHPKGLSMFARAHPHTPRGG